MRRYRFIVKRDNERLYEYLVRALAELDEVEVILDRREEPRRRGSGPPGRERIGPERRVQTRVDDGLREFGWAFIKIDRT
jgi:hypothetical protein